MSFLLGIVGIGLWTLLFAESIVLCAFTVVVLLPILYLICGQKKYMKFVMYMVDRTIWRHMVSILEWWGRSKIVYHGDSVPMRESALIISNHVFMADFWTIFTFAIRKGMLGCCKIFSKDAVKYIPGFGWGGYLIGFIFVKRNWVQDQNTITQTFSRLQNAGYPVWIIMHPESTRMAPGKFAEMVAFQKKHQEFPELRHTLLPRPKGFSSTVDALRGGLLHAVYDLTLVYPDGKPNLWNIACRRCPRVDIYVRRYPVDSLPTGETDLKNWLIRVWKEKDDMMEQYRANGNSFPKKLDEPLRFIGINF